MIATIEAAMIRGISDRRVLQYRSACRIEGAINGRIKIDN